MSAVDDYRLMKILTRYAFLITAVCIEIYGYLLLGLRKVLRTIIRLITRIVPRSDGFFAGVRSNYEELKREADNFKSAGARSDAGDVPGWVLVVLMTTGLVTAIWTIAAPRLSAILRNSLDAMNGIR